MDKRESRGRGGMGRERVDGKSGICNRKGRPRQEEEAVEERAERLFDGCYCQSHQLIPPIIRKTSRETEP